MFKRFVVILSWISVGIFLSIIFVAEPAMGNENSVPQLINYQGTLTDKDGKAIDGELQIKFLLFDQEVGGNLIWQETHDSVSVENGLFNVLLGSSADVPLTAAQLNGERYLEIQVADEVMDQRMQLVSVAYSLRSEQANNAYVLGAPDGDPEKAVYVDEEGQVGIGTANPEQPLDVAGTVRASEFLFGDNTSAQWKKIREERIDSPVFTFAGLNRPNCKAYKIYYYGLVKCENTDSRIIIRVNNASGNYGSSYYILGHFNEHINNFTDGFYLIRVGWGPANGGIAFEYTLHIADVLTPGVSAMGYGQAVFYNYNNGYHAFARSGGVWKTADTTITSISVLTNNGKNLSGRIVLYALE